MACLYSGVSAAVQYENGKMLTGSSVLSRLLVSIVELSVGAFL